jgi:hypothetical protein
MTKSDANTVDSSIKLTLAETKAELIRWIVGMALLQITIITALVFIMTGNI